MISIDQITIDPELEALLPCLSEQENIELMRSIDADGFRDPITVWLGRNILVDGHNRLRIKNTLYAGDDDKSPEIVERTFADRDAVVEWMLRNQLARRNLTDAMRVQIALRLKPFIEARAKANKRASGGAVPTKLEEPVDTMAEVAKVAGVSHGTARKVEAVLETAPEEIKAAMLAPKHDPAHVSIDKAYQQTKAATSPKVEQPSKPSKWVQGADSIPDVQEHAPEDSDSDSLFHLKQYWRKATKKDRKSFLDWTKDAK